MHARCAYAGSLLKALYDSVVDDRKLQQHQFPVNILVYSVEALLDIQTG